LSSTRRARAAAGHGGRAGIRAQVYAPPAGKNDKPRNYSQMPIIFAVGGNRPAFDHESASDRKALWQTAKLVAC